MAISRLDKEKINHEGYLEINSNDHSKISQIQESGEYMLDLKPDNDKSWIIRKNPSYATTRVIKLSSVFSALFAFISLIIVFYDSRSVNSDLNKRYDILHYELMELKKELIQKTSKTDIQELDRKSENAIPNRKIIEPVWE